MTFALNIVSTVLQIVPPIPIKVAQARFSKPFRPKSEHTGRKNEIERQKSEEQMEERTASIRGVRSGCCCCGRQPNAAQPARARQERKKAMWGG